MLRCTSPFPCFRRGKLIAAYAIVRLIPQDSRALPAAFLRSRPIFATFMTFYEVVNSQTGRAVIEKIEVSIRRMPGAEDLPLPRYMTGQAAGMDLMAAVGEEVTILPGERGVIPTGVAVALPEGYEAEIRPRSGLAARHGVTLVNSPGTIDADYRGEVRLILINHGQAPFVVRRGDRD